MAEVLKSTSLVFETEYLTSVGFFVDFYIFAEKRIIQTDGPLHFVARYLNGKMTLVLQPKDALMREILDKEGYEVESKDYHQVNRELDQMHFDKRQIADDEDHTVQEGFLGMFGGFKPDSN